ncbi:unnamed protein product, partial [marine sediment metagenome]
MKTNFVKTLNNLSPKEQSSLLKLVTKQIQQETLDAEIEAHRQIADLQSLTVDQLGSRLKNMHPGSAAYKATKLAHEQKLQSVAPPPPGSVMLAS